MEKAARFSPDQLRRIARRAIEAVEPDQKIVDAHENELIRTEEQAAREKCSLTLHDNGDGTTTGHFTIPALAAAMLGKVIDAMTAPRRMREPRQQRDRSFDWRHRRGLAFAELLEHLPTDHLHNKTAATVVVTIDHTVLAGAMKAAHLDTNQALSAGEARRLACNAGILPAVLGTKSVALDLGRESRLFSESQRVAKGLEHTTCAATGCERPYAWCELHHRQPWSQGGRTDLADAIPLCSQHHHWIHDTGFNHQTMPDGSIRFSRRREVHNRCRCRLSPSRAWTSCFPSSPWEIGVLLGAVAVLAWSRRRVTPTCCGRCRRGGGPGGAARRARAAPRAADGRRAAARVVAGAAAPAGRRHAAQHRPAAPRDRRPVHGAAQAARARAVGRAAPAARGRAGRHGRALRLRTSRSTSTHRRR